MISRSAYARLLSIALLPVLALLLASCFGSPQNTLAPEGDVADMQRDLFNLALVPAVIVFVLVEGALVYVLIRYRHRRGQSLPKQIHGNTRLEIAWTIAPAILLFALGVPMVVGIVDLSREPAADAMHIKAIGHQWIWEFQYPDYTDANGKPLSTFTELHIPAGQEIGAEVESTDVIHSFWMPKLAGKVDAIPGKTNIMWFNAQTPGTYPGQCAEFCGLSHGDMLLKVVVHTPEEFEQWVDDQLAKAAAPDSGESGLAARGD